MCFGFLFLRADGFCSGALSSVVVAKSPLSPAPTAVNEDEPAAPELLIFASGGVIQLLLVLLPLLVWFYFVFMHQRGPGELCTDPTPTSISLARQDSADSPTKRTDFLISPAHVSSQGMSLCLKHSRGQHCIKNDIGRLKTGCEE